MDISNIKMPDGEYYNIKDTIARQQIENLQRQNYKIILIGDSYGIQQFEENPITKYYWESFAESLGLEINTSFYNGSVSGASFSNGNYLQSLQNFNNIIENKNEITDIIVAGGWNDSYANITQSTILYNMDLFNTYAKTNYPNAKISIAHIGYSNPYITNSSANVNNVIKSIESYKLGANNLGWRYLNGTEYILHIYDTSYWQADGVHPSQLGQTELANYFTQAFLNGSINIQRKNADTGTVASASGIATAILNNSNMLFNMDNESSEIHYQGELGLYITLDNTTIINCNGASQYELAIINSPYWYGWNTRNSMNIPLVMQVTENDELKTYTGSATLTIKQGKLYFAPLLFNGNNAVTNVKGRYLYLQSLHMKCKTRYC